MLFRNDIVVGIGGHQILVDDPSGNPIELFEPTRDEARLADSDETGDPVVEYQVRPIGRVESSLVELADAPNQVSRVLRRPGWCSIPMSETGSET